MLTNTHGPALHIGKHRGGGGGGGGGGDGGGGAAAQKTGATVGLTRQSGRAGTGRVCLFM